jgi:hypothetical protein
MPLLTDLRRKLRDTPDDGDLVAVIYVPLRSCAERYGRLTATCDFEALESLRHRALADEVPEPKQLGLFSMEVA